MGGENQIMELINVNEIFEGRAGALPSKERLPELGDYATEEGRDSLNTAVRAFFYDPPVTKDLVISADKEGWNSLTLEQQTYMLATTIAYDIRDAYNELEKGGRNNPIFYQKFDNMLRWVMDNFNAVYVVALTRTILAVFHMSLNPQLLNNWDEFAGRFSSLILTA